MPATTEWVEKEEEHSRLTLEALAEVDEGATIDNKLVQAWVDSLYSDQPLPVSL
jgi:hypothetical protein